MKNNFFILILLLIIISTLSKRHLIEEESKNSGNNENESQNENEEEENTDNQNNNPSKETENKKSKNEKENNSNTEDEEEEEEEEDEEEIRKRKQKQLDEAALARSKIKKENLPLVQVLLPVRRFDTSNAQFDVSPCGGVDKKLANTLTSKGANINFIWEVQVPEYTGNCTVKISNGLQDEKNFKLLKPVDGEINEDGSFLCGREKGFEHREFKLPDDYECDGCTLQFTWSTPYGNIYSCSDVIINGGELENCMGKCLNGGSCFNGKCLCLKGFSGEFCEDSEESSSKVWLWVLLGILGSGALAAAGYKMYPSFKQWVNRKKSEGWLSSNNKSVSVPFDQGKNGAFSLPEEPNSNY